jgi:hypothetical protein
MLDLISNAKAGVVSTQSAMNNGVYWEEPQGFYLTKFHSILRVARSTLYTEYSVKGIPLVAVHLSRHDNVNVLKSTLVFSLTSSAYFRSGAEAYGCMQLGSFRKHVAILLSTTTYIDRIDERAKGTSKDFYDT